MKSIILTLLIISLIILTPIAILTLHYRIIKDTDFITKKHLKNGLERK